MGTVWLGYRWGQFCWAIDGDSVAGLYMGTVLLGYRWGQCGWTIYGDSVAGL